MESENKLENVTSSGGDVCCLFHDLDDGVCANPSGCDCSHFLDANVIDGAIESVGICHVTKSDVSSCDHCVSAIANDQIEESEI